MKKKKKKRAGAKRVMVIASEYTTTPRGFPCGRTQAEGTRVEKDRDLLGSECNFIVNLSPSEGKQWSDLRAICPSHFSSFPFLFSPIPYPLQSSLSSLNLFSSYWSSGMSSWKSREWLWRRDITKSNQYETHQYVNESSVDIFPISPTIASPYVLQLQNSPRKCCFHTF